MKNLVITASCLLLSGLGQARDFSNYELTVDSMTYADLKRGEYHLDIPPLPYNVRYSLTPPSCKMVTPEGAVVNCTMLGNMVYPKVSIKASDLLASIVSRLQGLSDLSPEFLQDIASQKASNNTLMIDRSRDKQKDQTYTLMFDNGVLDSTLEVNFTTGAIKKGLPPMNVPKNAHLVENHREREEKEKKDLREVDVKGTIKDVKSSIFSSLFRW